MTSARQLTPHWFVRWFGAQSATFQLENSGLRVETANGDSYVVLVESLAGKTLHEGLLFSRLVLRTDHGYKTFRGLRKQDAKALFKWMRAHWIEQLLPDVAQAAQQIRSLLNKGYPRKSRIDRIVSLARDAVSRFGVVPDPSWCEAVSNSPFTYVAEIAMWRESVISKLRQDYVAEQIKAFSSYFDRIESKPLTDRQREACVIDEDNNLVLAGAGTGKTSTMVSRAGYLIESGQARADEVLMLAFANKAANEMQERIEHRLGNVGVTASTFHKLGKDIIADVEGRQPSLTPLADDERALAAQVNEWYEMHLKEPGYRSLVLDYFQHHLYPAANPFDFDSEGAYFDYILANDIRTLKGEAVKSLGECLVANYLFKQGVDYQYEADYEYPTASPLFRQYRPDFYLPEFGIYIEYYGIDRAGNTAPYIDRQAYHKSMAWKRKLHTEKNTRLIELYHYQTMEGTVFEAIDHQLAKLDVVYQPLPSEAVLKTLEEFGAISNFAKLLADLLRRYRANCYEAGQIETVIENAANSKQVSAALALLKPILSDYQAFLDERGHIDFDDMVGKAINYIRQGQFKSPWRYILVDEFQDISDARARLVKYLRDSVPECSLFCVGDDWQAIYRFTGSDLAFTSNFEDRFGPAQITALDLTFRFNNSINDIASRFVLQNPAQLPKKLNTVVTVNRPAVSLMRSDNRSSSESYRLEKVLSRIATIAKPGSSVYLLGRYVFNLPNKEEIGRLARRFRQLSLEAHTMHASKGKEADYVVILGLESGKNGFPSKKVTNPLLEALLPPLESFPHAEERRLFYVALTRARHRVFMITDMAVASDFVVELLKNKYPIDLNEFETSLTQQLFHMIKCIKCKTGTIVERQSQSGKFFGCNKFPLCSHKEKGCDTCGLQMRRAGRFKICINPECKSWIPTCPECGAEMTRRKGKYGEFWGCRNYRYQGECCTHTEQEIIFKEELAEMK